MRDGWGDGFSNRPKYIHRLEIHGAASFLEYRCCSDGYFALDPNDKRRLSHTPGAPGARSSGKYYAAELRIAIYNRHREEISGCCCTDGPSRRSTSVDEDPWVIYHIPIAYIPGVATSTVKVDAFGIGQ